MLVNPQFKAHGDIYPCRFVSLSDNSTSDFYVEETVTAALAQDYIGISDEAGRDARADVNDTRAAKDGENVSVWGMGEVCLLEMAASCTRGQFLKANVTTDGKGIPVDETTGGGYQFYGAQALEDCSGSGIKIRVQVKQGQVHF